MSEQAWRAQTSGVGRNAGAPRAPSQPPWGPEMQFGASGFIPFAAPSQFLAVFIYEASQPPIHLHLGYECTRVFIKSPPIHPSVGLDCSGWKKQALSSLPPRWKSTYPNLVPLKSVCKCHLQGEFRSRRWI